MGRPPYTRFICGTTSTWFSPVFSIIAWTSGHHCLIVAKYIRQQRQPHHVVGCSSAVNCTPLCYLGTSHHAVCRQLERSLIAMDWIAALTMTHREHSRTKSCSQCPTTSRVTSTWFHVVRARVAQPCWHIWRSVSPVTCTRCGPTRRSKCDTLPTPLARPRIKSNLHR